jgi:hypothetical protein
MDGRRQEHGWNHYERNRSEEKKGIRRTEEKIYKNTPMK